MQSDLTVVGRVARTERGTINRPCGSHTYIIHHRDVTHLQLSGFDYRVCFRGIRIVVDYTILQRQVRTILSENGRGIESGMVLKYGIPHRHSGPVPHHQACTLFISSVAGRIAAHYMETVDHHFGPRAHGHAVEHTFLQRRSAVITVHHGTVLQRIPFSRLAGIAAPNSQRLESLEDINGS